MTNEICRSCPHAQARFNAIWCLQLDISVEYAREPHCSKE